MKKVFQRFILLFLAVITTMLFTACASHTHTFSEEWTYNATEHWHQATCEHKNEISEKGEHTFGGWTVKTQPTETSEGLEERSCSVCGYKETRVVSKTTHVHTFSDEWSFNETEHWHNATCDHKDVVSEKAAHTFGEWVVINEPQYGIAGSKSITCSVCGYEEIVEIPARNYFNNEEAITLIETCFDARDAVISFSLSRGDFTDVEIISIKDQKVKIAERNRVIYFANKAGSLYKYSSENNFYETALNNEADLRLATNGINAASILNYIMDSNLDMHEYLETSDFSFALNEDGSYSITHTADTEAIKGSLAYFIDYATYVKFNELSLEIGGSLDVGATYKLSINLEYEDVTIPEHTHIYSEEWSYDAEGHYHEALCPDGEEKHGLEAHTFGEWIIVSEAGYKTAGSKKHVCEVCGYEESVEIPARDYYLDEELLELIKNQFNSNVRRGVIIDRKEESVVEVLCYNNIFKVIYSFKDDINDSYNKYTDDAIYTYESFTGYYEEKYDGLPADVVKKLFTLGGVFNTLTESSVDFNTLFTIDKFEFEYDKENDAYKVTRKDVDDLITYEDASNESADFLQYYIDITKVVKFVDDSIVFVCNDEHTDYVIALGLNEIDEIIIPEHTHAYEENWHYDETSHWHNPICPDGEEKHELEPHTFGEWEVTIEATETKAGEKKHTCEACGYTETEVIPMTGEVFSNFVWAADYKSALAVYLLGDVEHAYAAKVEETSVTYCDKEGLITYTATHGDNTDSVQLPLQATGHNWDTPTYVWNDDNTKVTATRVCKNDNAHVETETVDVVVSGGATCTEAGDKVFTATFTKEGFETQTKTVHEDAFGHNCDIVFVWADDFSSATVKLVCKNDNTHIFELTDVVTVTSEVTTPSTCTKKGTITYTATVTINYPEYKAVGEFSENKTKEAELAEHNYVLEGSFDKENEKATVNEKCSVCGDIKQTKEVTLSDYKTLTDGDLVLVKSVVKKIEKDNSGKITKVHFEELVDEKPFILFNPIVSDSAVVFDREEALYEGDTVYAVGFAGTFKGQHELIEGCLIIYVDAPKFTLTLPNDILFDATINHAEHHTSLVSGEYVNGTNFKFGAVDFVSMSDSRYILLNGTVLVPDDYGVYEFNISEDTTIEVVLKAYDAVSKYVKAINTDYLYDGMEVVFANEESAKIGGVFDKYFKGETATFANGVMTTDATFPIIKLIKNQDKWIISVNGNSYIKINGTTGNKLILVDNLDDATKWTISFDEGDCLILSDEMYIQQNTNEGYFTNYKNTQSKIQLYVYTENYDLAVLYVASKEATCTEDGNIAYYLSCGKYYSDVYCKNELDSVVIPATGHSWGEPEWIWAADYSTATAKFTCSTCNEVEEVVATGEQITFDSNTNYYTATITHVNKQFENSRFKAFVFTLNYDQSLVDVTYTISDSTTDLSKLATDVVVEFTIVAKVGCTLGTVTVDGVVTPLTENKIQVTANKDKSIVVEASANELTIASEYLTNTEITFASVYAVEIIGETPSVIVIGENTITITPTDTPYIVKLSYKLGDADAVESTILIATATGKANLEQATTLLNSAKDLFGTYVGIDKEITLPEGVTATSNSADIEINNAEHKLTTLAKNLDGVTVTLTATYQTATINENITFKIAIADVLVNETFGVDGSAYKNWENKVAQSGVKYSGNSAGSYDSIQLRYEKSDSNKHSGIVTTTSVGSISSIKISWEEHTTDSREISIYGKDSPYSSYNDLYNASTRGTLLGDITKGSNNPTILDFSNDAEKYRYIGIIANGALYIESITIIWDYTEEMRVEDASKEFAEEYNIGQAINLATNNVIATADENNAQYVALSNGGRTITIGNNQHDGVTLTLVSTKDSNVTKNVTFNIKNYNAEAQALLDAAKAEFTDEQANGAAKGAIKTLTTAGVELSSESELVSIDQTNKNEITMLNAGNNVVVTLTAKYKTASVSDTVTFNIISVFGLSVNETSYTSEDTTKLVKNGNEYTWKCSQVFGEGNEAVTVTYDVVATIATAEAGQSVTFVVNGFKIGEDATSDYVVDTFKLNNVDVNFDNVNNNYPVTFVDGVNSVSVIIKKFTTAKTYTFTITTLDFNTTSYAANNSEKTTVATATDDSGDTISVKWTSNQVYQNSEAMQWQKNAGYIYNSTDLGTIESVTINSTAGSFTIYYGNEEQPNESTTVGDGFFMIKVGNATGKTSSIVVVFTV